MRYVDKQNRHGQATCVRRYNAAYKMPFACQYNHYKDTDTYIRY